MLLDLFEKTLKLPLKSKVVTQPYVDFLANQYQLNHNGFHGIEHWFRVLINARLIAAEVGADIDVVEHFALLHDVMRKDEKLDMDATDITWLTMQQLMQLGWQAIQKVHL